MQFWVNLVLLTKFPGSENMNIRKARIKKTCWFGEKSIENYEIKPSKLGKVKKKQTFKNLKNGCANLENRPVK